MTYLVKLVKSCMKRYTLCNSMRINSKEKRRKILISPLVLLFLYHLSSLSSHILFLFFYNSLCTYDNAETLYNYAGKNLLASKQNSNSAFCHKHTRYITLKVIYHAFTACSNKTFKIIFVMHCQKNNFNG